MKILEVENLQGRPIAIVTDKITFFLEGEQGTHVYLVGDEDGFTIKTPYKEVLSILSEDDRVEITGNHEPELNVCRHPNIIFSAETMDKVCADCGAVLAR